MRYLFHAPPVMRVWCSTSASCLLSLAWKTRTTCSARYLNFPLIITLEGLFLSHVITRIHKRLLFNRFYITQVWETFNWRPSSHCLRPWFPWFLVENVRTGTSPRQTTARTDWRGWGEAYRKELWCVRVLIMCLLIVSLKHEQICMTCLGFKDMQNISVDNTLK